MHPFDQVFVELSAYRVAVCRSCHQAVLPGAVKTHVNTRHRYLPVEERRQIVERALALEQAGALASDVDHIVFPSSQDTAVAGLPVWSDGKKCTMRCRDGGQCGQVRRTRSGIQQHCRDEHGWVNERARGGRPGAMAAGGQDKVWVDGVHCQRFGRTGALQRLFEVAAPPAEPNTSQPNPEGQQVLLQQQFDTLAKAIVEGDRKAAALIGEQTRFSANMWIRRSGWPRHLRKFDRAWLVETTRAPSEQVQDNSSDDDDGEPDEDETASGTASETALARTLLAVSRVIWRAQRASRVEVVGSAAMNYVERREAGGQTDEKPFNAGQKAQTMERYSASWKAVMAYVWRTHHLDVVDADADAEGDGHEGTAPAEGIRDKRPAYELTQRQADAFKRLQQAAHVRTDEPEMDREDDDRDAGAEGENEGEGADARALERHVLVFFIELMDHDIGDNEFQNALYSGLAVLGVDVAHGWRSALVYTPRLSAIVTVARMLVLYKAVQDRRIYIKQRRQTTGESEQEASRKAQNHFNRVKGMVQKFMTIIAYDGQPSPMDSILRLRAYGRAIRANTNADGVVDWHGDELLYGHVQFTMGSLRTMVHGLLHSARMQLRQEILLVGEDGLDPDGEVDATAGLPSIQWHRLVDNPAETRAGWSFVDDPRNDEALGRVDGKTWLASRVAAEERLRAQFIEDDDGTGTIRWKMDGVRAYAARMKSFRAKLLVLMHMSGGQPARGTELVTVQYKNGAGGDIRGIFIDDGAVAFVTMYNKTMGMSAKAKVIYRYLPREVGVLVVYYVWLAIPFWRIIVKGASQAAADWGSPYMWEPRQEGPWAFPGTIEKGGKRGKRKRPAANEPQSSTQPRQLPSPPRSSDPTDRDPDRDESNESRPDTRTDKSDMWEAEQWDTGRVGRAIGQVSVAHMGEKLTIMVWRHAVKAIYRRYIKDKQVIEIMEAGDTIDGGDGDDKDDKGVGDAFHNQSGHGASIGDAIYGRSIDESLYSTEARRLGFRRVSREWHAFLMFDSVLREAGAQRTTSRFRDVAQQAAAEEARRWKLMREVNIQAQLEQMVGAGTAFRGVQEPALRAIMRQESPVVVVMGTGGGKSMLFMLPARCSRGLTVVVVPLVSLRNDIKDRCDVLGIECVEWSSRRPHEWAAVVLVTPESAVGEAFGHFINRQRAMGRLDRIVIDECHVVLDSGPGGNWRARMLQLKGLAKAETQLVYLTATLRPADEGRFGEMVGLPAEGVRWFRSATTRKNVRYAVRRFHTPDETEEDVVTALVEEKKTQYGQGQIIVYCDTVEKAKRYAKRLGGVCFYRGVGSPEHKKAIVRQLTEGQHQVFTATNALGLGVDAPTIRVVIHVGMVRGLRNYAQESGRAGRDGAPSEAIIVQSVRTDRRGRPIQEEAKDVEARGVEKEMWEFIETRGCVRAVLGREMDGQVGRERCMDGEEECYRCVAASRERRSQVQYHEMVDEQDRHMDEEVVREDENQDVDWHVEVQHIRVQRRVQGQAERTRQAGEASEVERFGAMLEQWAIGCTWCRATGEDEWICASHTMEACGGEDVEDVEDMVQRWEKAIRWEPYSCCFDCGLPQAVCNRYEAQGDGGYKRREGRCQYPGVLIRSVVSMWGANGQEAAEFFQQQLRQRGVEWEETDGEEALIKWMGRKVRWAGIESNEMCRVMVRLYDVCQAAKG